MADNLLNMAMRQLGPAGIGALNSALGLPEGKGESALNAGLATTIAGMLHTANEQSGLGKLLSMVTGSGRLDLSSIASVVGDPEQLSSLQQSGASLLDGIFGSGKDGVVHTLSSALGLSDSVGGGAMKVIAPILMSVLGKIAQSEKMDVGGLATLLLGQKPFIADKLPGGMLQELGITSFDKLGEGARVFPRGHAEPQAARTPEQRHVGSYGKWLWPLLAALVALYALNMCTQRERAETPEVIGSESAAAVTDFGSRFREYLAGTARDPNREFPQEVHFDSEADRERNRRITVPVLTF